jgi:hypothetical protein
MMPVGPTPNSNTNQEGHPGMHDPAMLQAAQLLLPGDYQAPCKYIGSPRGSIDVSLLNNYYLALPYLPEDLNHFQEFTHFLDSIGLPAEWLPFEADPSQIQDIGIEDVQKPIAPSQEQMKRPRSIRDGSRGDSPFRSWLPSVPRGDQSLGTLSDSGKSCSICNFKLGRTMSHMTFRATAGYRQNLSIQRFRGSTLPTCCIA